MIVTRTPLRVSFIGGGTDFPDYYNQHGGACLSAAINKHIYVMVKPRFDKKIVLHYSKTETVDSIDAIEHDLIRECLRMVDVHSGIEIATMADIPATGTGLGSSSSLTVGLLNALYALQGITRAPGDLAQDACQIELVQLGHGMGKQDQYAAAFGGLRVYVFTAGNIQHSHFPRRTRRKVQDQLMLFYTGQTRQAAGILTEQNDAIEANLDTLGRMVALCKKGATLLKMNDVSTFGSLIDTDWNLKQQLHPGVSNPSLDAMYATALNAGADGGKVCGAGGGGFLLLWVPPASQADVRAALSDFQELPFGIEERGSTVILKE